MVQTVRDTLLGLGQGIRVYTVQPLERARRAVVR